MLRDAQLWAGAVNFPDFFAQQTIDWWTSQIKGLHSQLPLDGLWIDMHEPSSFCTGDVCQVPGDFFCLHSAWIHLMSRICSSMAIPDQDVLYTGICVDWSVTQSHWACCKCGAEMSYCSTDDDADPATDFDCKLTCASGTAASPNATFIAPPGIYNPPYMINNNNTQLDLATKVTPLTSVLYHPSKSWLCDQPHCDTDSPLIRSNNPFAWVAC